MGLTMYIKLSNTLSDIQFCLARGDANFHRQNETECEEEKNNTTEEQMQ